jgi:predicted DNA-binding transcriptional regulator AlpA
MSAKSQLFSPANDHFICMISSDLLRVKDLALLLGVSERTALRFLKATDGIESFHLGPRQIRTTRRHVEAFIERRQEKSKLAKISPAANTQDKIPLSDNHQYRPCVNT